MYKVLDKDKELYSARTLDEAMAFAKVHAELVVIEGNGMEIVGKFGADSVKDGKLPDGHDYTWYKRRNP